MVVAVQHALDYPTVGRAAAVCAVALVVILLVAIVLALLFGRVASSIPTA
jgi:hypothetical protein